MKIAFDIGGVLSKWPDQFRELMRALAAGGVEIYVITDMHNREEVTKTLSDNGFDFIPLGNVYHADYPKYGEFSKPLLVKALGIDMLIDDFPGYLQWDSTMGTAPIRLMTAPDGFRPYWHETWKTPGDQDFGRRVTSAAALKQYAPPAGEGER